MAYQPAGTSVTYRYSAVRSSGADMRARSRTPPPLAATAGHSPTAPGLARCRSKVGSAGTRTTPHGNWKRQDGARKGAPTVGRCPHKRSNRSIGSLASPQSLRRGVCHAGVAQAVGRRPEHVEVERFQAQLDDVRTLVREHGDAQGAVFQGQGAQPMLFVVLNAAAMLALLNPRHQASPAA